MDAIKFIKEWNRMCKFYYDAIEGYCSCECPAHCFQCFNLKNLSANAEDLAAVIEKWSTEHPRETRQSVFLEQYPNAKVDKWNVLCACPADIYGAVECADLRGTCTDCRREFWSQE